jgi:hypothetical protein
MHGLANFKQLGPFTSYIFVVYLVTKELALLFRRHVNSKYKGTLCPSTADWSQGDVCCHFAQNLLSPSLLCKYVNICVQNRHFFCFFMGVELGISLGDCKIG